MRAIHRFDILDSTMTKAAELAEAGAESGTVVVAGEQQAGQGRLGRQWHSEPEAGLYMTEIIRPKLPPGDLPVVTIAIGLGVAEAIAEAAGIACDLKWPNDVLVDGAKVAGILVQLHQGALLAGIGINVNHEQFPESLTGIATSLRMKTGRKHSREALLHILIGKIDSWLEVLFEKGKDPVLLAFSQASSYVSGRRVVVEQADGEIRGVTDGLNPQGFLYVRQDDGRRTLILAGGVRPASGN